LQYWLHLPWIVHLSLASFSMAFAELIDCSVESFGTAILLWIVWDSKLLYNVFVITVFFLSFEFFEFCPIVSSDDLNVFCWICFFNFLVPFKEYIEKKKFFFSLLNWWIERIHILYSHLGWMVKNVFIFYTWMVYQWFLCLCVLTQKAYGKLVCSRYNTVCFVNLELAQIWHEFLLFQCLFNFIL